MKKLATILTVLMVGTFFVAGSSMAMSFSQDYWKPAHNSAQFTITLENASYESDFGLYAFEDPMNRLQVFDKADEPSPVSQQTIYFQNNGGWEVSIDNSTWMAFSNTFGFYFGVYTGGVNDSILDYLWFTDPQYNQKADGTNVDTTIEHIGTDWNGIIDATIYLDDQFGGGDRSFDDMVVTAHDVEPVPEPATMLLLGTGLIGLAAIGRKRFLKK